MRGFGKLVHVGRQARGTQRAQNAAKCSRILDRAIARFLAKPSIFAEQTLANVCGQALAPAFLIEPCALLESEAAGEGWLAVRGINVSRRVLC